jgi:tRNA G46 methylase TrmB
VKLEIGAGVGEWAVAQARADQGCANWLALELRCDRAYQIFCQQLYSCSNTSDNNLAVATGDAHRVLNDHIATASTQAIFINHPEPPERSMLVDKRSHSKPRREEITAVKDKGKSKTSLQTRSKVQGKHMLTHDFLQQCLRVLQESGTLTVVTDSLPYGQLLLDTLAAVEYSSDTRGEKSLHGFKSVRIHGASGDDMDVDASLEFVEYSVSSVHSKKLTLWRGEPGPICGHAVVASSYFDRLWDRGNKKRRWFIYVKKASISR